MATISEYHKRKAKIIKHLGSKCVQCGSEYDLQIDHMDHTRKNYTVMSHWGWSWKKLLEELKLCQLLCSNCHLEKTISEGSLTKGWTTQPQGPKHGTAHTYIKYKCRCDLCKIAKQKSYLGVAKSG
jgi:hypothetical protein